MEPRFRLNLLICFTIFSHGNEASPQTMRQKNIGNTFDEQVATIKTWVDQQDNEKFCFGLIVESSTIEAGLKTSMKANLCIEIANVELLCYFSI